MKLGDICLNITDGKHGDCNNQPGSGYYFLSAKDVTDRNLDYSNAREIEKADFIETHNRTRLEPGDILLTNSGTIGRLAIARDEDKTFHTTFQKSVAILKPDIKKVYSEYLYYFFVYKNQEIVELASGTTQKNLLLGDLRNYELALPPLPEQRAIADVLSALDDKIELNRRMNQTLEQLAQAIFKHWFIDNPEREGWEDKTIGEVVTIVGGSTPSTTNIDYWEGGSIHWATPKDLASLQSPILLDTNSTITELGLKQISSGLLPVGTVLLSSRAPIGYMVITHIPVAINQGFIGIKCNEDMPNYYILNWLKVNLEEIIGRANGTTFLEISKSNFRPILMKIPPAELMEKFVSTIEPLYKKITANLIDTATLAELRDTLLPKLMSGQVRVNPTVTMALDASSSVASGERHEAIS